MALDRAWDAIESDPTHAYDFRRRWAFGLSTVKYDFRQARRSPSPPIVEGQHPGWFGLVLKCRIGKERHASCRGRSPQAMGHTSGASLAPGDRIWVSASRGVLAKGRRVFNMRKLLVSAAFVCSLALGVGAANQAAAAPAAASSANANCVAQSFQPLAQDNGRLLGDLLSSVAQASGGVGQFLGPAASSNCNF